MKKSKKDDRIKHINPFVLCGGAEDDFTEELRESMNAFDELWQGALALMKQDLAEITIKTWINYLRPVDLTGDRALFTVPQQLQRDIIRARYLGDIQRCLAAVIGFETEIEVVTEAELLPEQNQEPDAPEPESSVLKPPVLDDLPASQRYTFDNFIVGNSNKFAHAAAKAAAEQPGSVYNPLFIYGESGLGKTHLLYAIAGYMEHQFPSFRIKFVSADDFSNQLIEAINNRTTAEFRNSYRSVDVLLIDDVQFLGRTDATQEEVFHTFNTLYAAKKQIILTSDRPPKEIATLEDRLRTRFEQGLLADVKPPDFETRSAILKRKAEMLGIPLPPDVVDFVATKVKSNIRQLEGAVKKMQIYMMLGGGRATIEIAEKAIADITTESEPVTVTVEKIIAETAKFYNTTADEIRGSRRSADIALARQVAMYLIREITGMPNSFVGEQLGGRNHSTVIHACNKIEEMRAENPQLNSVLSDIKNNLKSE